MNDDDLMREISRGDEKSWRELIARYEQYLYNYFYHLSNDAQKAEDATQEIFLRLWKNAHTYTAQGKLLTYVMRIARNFWIDQIRAHKMNEVAISENDLIDKTAPIDQLIADDLQQRVKIALTQLPEKHREILIWLVVEEFSYAEISDILEVPIGTVKSRIFYALKMLREILGVNNE